MSVDYGICLENIEKENSKLRRCGYEITLEGFLKVADIGYSSMIAGIKVN